MGVSDFEEHCMVLSDSGCCKTREGELLALHIPKGFFRTSVL